MAERLTIKQLITHHVGPLDLALKAGECLALSGPSGAGKTLLLRAIADLDVHEGELLVDGVSCSSMRAHEWRRLIGLLPAEGQWWGEHIGDHFKGIDEKCLSELGFDKSVMEWEVERCSTGERQRLALLRLLENRPSVLLLDEPTASLDTDNIERVENLIARLRHEQGVSVIWVSHDAAQARRVSNRSLLIRSGQLQEVE